MLLHEPVDHSRGELMLLDPAVLGTGGDAPLRVIKRRFVDKRWRKFQRKALAYRFAGFSSLTGSMSTAFSWNAQNNLTGSAYNPTTNSSAINKKQIFGTQAANSASGGCDECFSFQQGITAGGSATLDLTAMTDLLQRASPTFVRVKGYQFRVLSSTDDSTLSPAPNAASVGLVTNIGPTLPSPLGFQAGGSGGTVTLTGSGAVTGVAVGAGGTGYSPSTFFLASPVQTSGSGCVFLCTTNGSGVISAMTFITGAGGAGYSAATVPLIAVGQCTILTGGALCYFDPSATGTAVSSTQKNIKLINLDGSNAITFEIDIFGCST